MSDQPPPPAGSIQATSETAVSVAELQALEEFPALHHDLLWADLGGGILAWGGLQGRVAVLDEFEATLARLCDGAVSSGELMRDVAVALNVDGEEAKRIVVTVIRRLAQLGFLISTRDETFDDSMARQRSDVRSGLGSEGAVTVSARPRGTFAGRDLFHLDLPPGSCAGQRVQIGEDFQRVSIMASCGPVTIRTNDHAVARAIDEHCSLLSPGPHPIGLHAIVGAATLGERPFALLADCLGQPLARCWETSDLIDAVGQYLGLDRSLQGAGASTVRLRLLSRGQTTVAVAEGLFRSTPGTEMAVRRLGWTTGATPVAVLDVENAALCVPRWHDRGARPVRPTVILKPGGSLAGSGRASGEELVRWLAERTQPGDAEGRRAAFNALRIIAKDCVLQGVARDRHRILEVLRGLG